MADIHQQIAQLEGDIRGQETILTDLEAEIVDLKRDIGAFKARYDLAILPLENKLEVVRGTIKDLKDQKYRREGHPLGDYRPMEDTWDPGRGYVSVEEQYRRTWQKPAYGSGGSNANRIGGGSSSAQALGSGLQAESNPVDADIKKLYRQLARRYHPDLATDNFERDRRTNLMARINEAYAERDLRSLQLLASQPKTVPLDAPLASLRLKELEQISHQLRQRIRHLQSERDELNLSDMMRLAWDDKMSALRGRDLLGEMARELDYEINNAMIELEKLRQ